MIPGIKVGPKTYKKIFRDYSPLCCEVWFRADWVDQYQEMFSYLQKHNIRSGLHFWGILPGEIMPNFAFPDPLVRKPSLRLVKQTIDVASEHNFSYVNIHPGSFRLSRVNLDRLFFRPVKGRETSPEESYEILLENVEDLHAYARKRGVLFFVETLPAKEPMHWRDLLKGRLRTQEMLNVPVSQLELLAEKDFFICNDFCHTAMDVVSDDRDLLFDELFEKTKRLASQTKLIHVSTVPPPFNGTDGHLGILRQDFKRDSFPTREQMKQLLALFAGRDDVWVIPEPFSHHVENSRALEEILEEIQRDRKY